MFINIYYICVIFNIFYIIYNIFSIYSIVSQLITDGVLNPLSFPYHLIYVCLSLYHHVPSTFIYIYIYIFYHLSFYLFIVLIDYLITPIDRNNKHNNSLFL